MRPPINPRWLLDSRLIAVEWGVITSLLAAVLVGCSTSATAPVTETKMNSSSSAIAAKPFAYKEGDTELEGVVATPTTSGKHPVVLVIHDWNGQDAYEAGRAQQLADLGYIGFAIDVYGKTVRPKTPQESGAEAGKYYANRDLFRKRLQAAFDAAKTIPGADTSKMAVMGYCFGGGGALEMGRMGLPLKGVASFHGGFKTDKPAKEGVFTARVLIEHAKGDPASPKADQDALFAELKAAKVNYQVTLYDLNTHAFTVPGAMYDEKADKQSWKELEAFLKEVFA